MSPDRAGSPTRVVDYIVDYLAGKGVEYIFGVGGANIEDLYDAAHFCDSITAILAKHEFSAATMADGCSRSGSGVGVVAATSGGACLNLVPALGESLISRVPVLAIVGQPPMAMDGKGSFQDTSGMNGALDAEKAFAGVSLCCVRVREPRDIVVALPQAVAAARAGGPAVLLLPKDIQQAQINVATPVVNGRAARQHSNRQSTTMASIVGQLVSGPATIIAGEQVVRDDAQHQLEQLRAALGAQVATVPDAKDAVAEPTSTLGVTGVMGHPAVGAAIASSSLCLLVGTRLPATARAGLESVLATTFTASIGSAVPYLPCAHVHTDDLRITLQALTREVGRRRPLLESHRHPAPSDELRPPAYVGAGVRYREAMAVLDAALPDDADIAVDAGNTGAAAIHYLPVRRCGRYLVALGMGGMGYSFGAGIGMAFVRRRRTVIVAGDGAFFMHGMELHTAIEHQLPVTVVLFNNNAHAMCVSREQLFYGERYSYNRFRPSRLGAGLAAMFPGLPSVDVADIDELPTAIAAALGADGPSVLSIECSPDEIPPFVPFLSNDAPASPVRQTDSTKEQIDVAARA